MSKKIVIALISITIALIISITIAVSYAMWTITIEQEESNIVQSGCFSMEIISEKNAINLNNAYPITDNEAKNLKPYTFTITNTCSISSSYKINLELLNGTTLNTSYVAIKVDDESKKILSSLKESTKQEDSSIGSREIATGLLSPNERKTYNIRIWMDEAVTLESNAEGKILNGKIVVESSPTDETNTHLDLYDAILLNNEIITTPTTLTTTSEEANETGLYVSTSTNSKEPTYYFRGAVENNYIEFAGFTWRIVRINEDGTIRIVLNEGINDNAEYQFNTQFNTYEYMYYSNSLVKTELENWYANKLLNHSDYIASGEYFCEEAKTILADSWSSGNTVMESFDTYTPNYKCKTDGNGKGIINSNIGLLTYDDLTFSGAFLRKHNYTYYLYTPGTTWWTMSPAGYATYNQAYVWENTSSSGEFSQFSFYCSPSNLSRTLRPVINLNQSVKVSGEGTIDKPYIVKTN